jgi:nucleoside-diphosphate-sugar epimerase
MQLLITSAASSRSQGLAVALRAAHTVRLTDRVHVDSEVEFARCSLDHDFATNLLVRGMEAIIHVAEPLPGDNEIGQIDFLTRCTYNLLWAAAEEGVRRVIYLSSLALLEQYDPAYLITEQWRPRPTTAAPLLAKHLGESVCREFAREHKLEVVVLRLGQVVEADLAQAISQALTAVLGPWSVFHIRAELPQSRFSIERAKTRLGYSPTGPVE